MIFLETPTLSERSPSQTNFAIEEDHDGSDVVSAKESSSTTYSNYLSLRCAKKTIAVLFIVIVSLTIALSVVSYLYNSTIPPFEICKTKGCARTATLFLRTMDETVDPCEDFHKFACGNWISDTATVAAVPLYDHTTIMRDRIVGRLRGIAENIGSDDIEALRQVKLMYLTCVDFDSIEKAGLQPLVHLITRLLNPNNTIAKTLAIIRRETGQSYIFDLSTDPDYKNSSVNTIFVDQPELPLQRNIFQYSPNTADAYRILIEKILLRIGKQLHFSSKLKDDIKGAAKDIWELDRKLAMASTPEENRNKKKMWNLVTIKELNSMYTNFNWMEYFSTLFEGLVDVEITNNFIVNINDLAYIHNLAEILNETDKMSINKYIMWQLMYTFGKDVTREFRQFFASFAYVLDGSETTPNRHTECIDLLDKSLPFALTHKYILKYVNQLVLDETDEMVWNIINSFKEKVSTLNWMDTHTKNKALLKADKVRVFIGYPKWLPDPNAVNEYYKGLYFDNHSFFNNMLAMTKWISEKSIKDFGKEVDETWSSTDSPAEADAFYDDELNAITLPVGFLQEPFVGMGLRSVDYGALGAVIGHELTHGFDTEGRYSDENGRLNEWWTGKTMISFLNKAECFAKQYGKFWLPELGSTPGPNNTVNGKRTLAENIADNGGIREAFSAYGLYIKKKGHIDPRLPGLEKYSSEQIFFLSFAQSWCSYMNKASLSDMVETNEHSPAKFRILGPLSNFDEFSQIWQCSNASRMNPSNKCVLW